MRVRVPSLERLPPLRDLALTKSRQLRFLIDRGRDARHGDSAQRLRERLRCVRVRANSVRLPLKFSVDFHLLAPRPNALEARGLGGFGLSLRGIRADPERLPHALRVRCRHTQELRDAIHAHAHVRLRNRANRRGARARARNRAPPVTRGRAPLNERALLR